MNDNNILFKNFKKKQKDSNIRKKLLNLLKERSQILLSLSKKYSDNFSRKQLSYYSNYLGLRCSFK